MTTKPKKIFIRRCRECPQMYKTTMRYSRVCPKCDKSFNHLNRSRDKIMLNKDGKTKIQQPKRTRKTKK